MELSIKNIFLIIFSLFLAFTLFWFIKFGTVFWFLGALSNSLSEKSHEHRKEIQHQAKIKSDRIKYEKFLSKVNKQKEYEARIFISSGNNSKFISNKEKLCNEAIFKAMSDKSEEAKINKKLKCSHNIQ